jgi:hypothetical protein
MFSLSVSMIAPGVKQGNKVADERDAVSQTGRSV